MATDTQPIDFVTFGMFILDQIHFSEDAGEGEGAIATTTAKMVDDIVGGAGTYAIAGARLFCNGAEKDESEASPRRLGWIVDAGSDFPDGVEQELDGWNTSLVLRRDNGRKTTRGWNSYGKGEHRAFKYLTPKLRLEPSDIIHNLPLLSSRSFHIISSPTRAMSIVTTLLGARKEDLPPPMFLWEPVPDLCTPEHLDDCLQTLKSIDIVSPNVSELAAFYGVVAEEDYIPRETVEELGMRWMDTGTKVGIVARAGKQGCLVVARSGEDGGCEKVWLPAYYSGTIPTPGDKGVNDPTGGGNAFMGGLAIGYLRTQNLITAACYGNIAASFIIEQIGMPELRQTSNGEFWNDIAVQERIKKYLEAIGRN